MHTPNGLYSLWDLLGSFLSKSNGARPLALNRRGAHLIPILAKNSSDPKKPKMKVELQDDSNGWQTPVGTSFLQTRCPLNTRENPPPIMDLKLQEPGMWNIWDHIPLHTIFPHKCNGYTFKTPFTHSKAHHQSIIPFLKEDSSYSCLQSMVISTGPFDNIDHLGV
ncbi:hypothetical protein O181_119285 [Austropuccinia psidii MF-1]|uniref:Uncharacterized protein n=1 Tax=Austropuccinia psidii MF-1 TaxID=1389203 RepID=A0A9Q3KDS0_9BASI|nr:hypothetical protein [Austropuccinia psidii MF-1]